MGELVVLSRVTWILLLLLLFICLFFNCRDRFVGCDSSKNIVIQYCAGASTTDECIRICDSLGMEFIECRPSFCNECGACGSDCTNNCKDSVLF